MDDEALRRMKNRHVAKVDIAVVLGRLDAGDRLPVMRELLVEMEKGVVRIEAPRGPATRKGGGIGEVLPLIVGAGRPIGAEEIRRTSGLHLDTVRSYLSKLTSQGLIARVSHGLYQSLPNPGLGGRPSGQDPAEAPPPADVGPGRAPGAAPAQPPTREWGNVLGAARLVSGSAVDEALPDLGNIELTKLLNDAALVRDFRDVPVGEVPGGWKAPEPVVYEPGKPLPKEAKDPRPGGKW
jgi:hypothetical protein